MDEPSPAQPGIFASLKRLLALTLAVAQNRLELLFVEFREERLEFFHLLLLAGIVIVLTAMTLAVITVALVFLCIQHNQPNLLIGLILLYVVATAAAFWRLRRRLMNWKPFSATIAELKKDQACFADKT